MNAMTNFLITDIYSRIQESQDIKVLADISIHRIALDFVTSCL